MRICAIAAAVIVSAAAGCASTGGEMASAPAAEHAAVNSDSFEFDIAALAPSTSAQDRLSPVFAQASSANVRPPREAMLAHEGKAAAHWNGRIFMAHGRALDGRTRETKLNRISDEIPKGWEKVDDRLRHRESGLECPTDFDIPRSSGENRAFKLSDVTAYDERGRDVSCNYTADGDAIVTVYASYYPDVSLQDHAAAAVAAIRQSFGIKGVLPVITADVEAKDGSKSVDLEEPIAGAFDIGEINGIPYKSSLWLAKTHGWHVKARATYAQSDTTVELFSAVMFAVSYLGVDMKNKLTPTAAGPEV